MDGHLAIARFVCVFGLLGSTSLAGCGGEDERKQPIRVARFCVVVNDKAALPHPRPENPLSAGVSQQGRVGCFRPGDGNVSVASLKKFFGGTLPSAVKDSALIAFVACSS